MHPHHNAARTTAKRLAIVARVSTEDQEVYGTSLEDQVAKGRAMAQVQDYTVDDRPYQDGGLIYSGNESDALPLAQRPIMSRLIADARAHKFEAVVFAKIDRIARRLRYILDIWDALDEAGVTVLVLDPLIDTSTPIGRLIRNVLGSISEFERDTIRERTQGGLKRRLARRPDGSLAPGWVSGVFYGYRYGYRYQKADRSTGRVARVTIHEEEAEVIRTIFRRRIQGVSYGAGPAVT